MARILISRRWPAAVEAEIAARHDLSFDASDRALTESDLIDAMQQFDVICPTVSDLITAQIIEAPRRRARILANFGAGVDHIDCAAALTRSPRLAISLFERRLFRFVTARRKQYDHKQARSHHSLVARGSRGAATAPNR